MKCWRDSAFKVDGCQEQLKTYRTCLDKHIRQVQAEQAAAQAAKGKPPAVAAAAALKAR